MATTSTIKRNFPLQLYKFTDMGNDINTTNLLSSLNANNSFIPNGASAVQIGNSSNENRCVIMVIKNGTDGRGRSVSRYDAINNLNLLLSGGTWTVST